MNKYKEWLEAQKVSDALWEDIRYELSLLASTVGDGAGGDIEYCETTEEGVGLVVFPNNPNIPHYPVLVPHEVLLHEDPKQAARDLRHENRMQKVDERKEERRKLYESLREEFEDGHA